MQVSLPVIIGPTASGKSSLALDVARLLGGRGRAEIVNADAMAIYRGMDIGTAKATRAERDEIVHHVVDVADVSFDATVADFQRLARAAIADCQARGVVPVMVGGSALYVRAIVDHFEFPGTDPDVRARWEHELAQRGPEALHAELARRDPDAAQAILPGNGRRIVRALEVIELTGSFHATLPDASYALAGVRQYGLRLDRAAMDQRIDDRVDAMWQAGLVDEVRGLEEELRASRTAARGLGYSQVLQFLAGEISEEQAKEDTKRGTRRFARKQLMWWRRDPRITWLEADDPTNAQRIVDGISPTL